MMAEMGHEPRRAGMLDVAKTVLFGLIGVRRKADHERVQIVLVALFIFTLLTVVRIVLG
jgi:hypothetical protein